MLLARHLSLQLCPNWVSHPYALARQGRAPTSIPRALPSPTVLPFLYSSITNLFSFVQFLSKLFLPTEKPFFLQPKRHLYYLSCNHLSSLSCLSNHALCGHVSNCLTARLQSCCKVSWRVAIDMHRSSPTFAPMLCIRAGLLLMPCLCRALWGCATWGIPALPIPSCNAWWPFQS